MPAKDLTDIAGREEGRPAPAGCSFPSHSALKGKGTLYYTAELRYSHPRRAWRPRDEGIGIATEILDEKGAIVPGTDLGLGKVYTMKVVFYSSQRQDVSRAAGPAALGRRADRRLPRDLANREAGGRTRRSQDSEEGDTGYEGDYGDCGLHHAHLRQRGAVLLRPGWTRGKHEVSFLFRTTTPGVYPTPPVQAELMYQPEVFGRTAGAVYRIRRRTSEWRVFTRRRIRVSLRGRPGKIEVVPTKKVDTQRDLSLAYTPGVARVVEEIERRPETAFEYTARGNLVAVITNGTAILGLGNRGPLAAKPVMEGKAVLFKRFADIDVFDIELDARTPDEMVAAVAALAPTFGGINLEDIKAPECFEVERRLKEMLDIPVFHDDQHGTAIITGAALLNALEITGKKIGDDQGGRLRRRGRGDGLRGVLRDAWAPRGSTSAWWTPRASCHAGRRENMNPYKERFAVDTDERTLADAVRGRRCLPRPFRARTCSPLPCSLPWRRDRSCSPAQIPIPRSATSWRGRRARTSSWAPGAATTPTRSTTSSGFPFIFRGALDVRARAINDAMKLAAARALAELAHEGVPECMLEAFADKALGFGPDYLIPKPLDPRILFWVAPAVAKAAMETRRGAA